MPEIRLGNVAPHDKLTIPDTGERVVVPYPHIEQSMTVIQVPADWGFTETLLNVTQHTWPHMSSEPPAWVSCPEDEGLQAAIARTLGCPEGEPEDWENIIHGPGPQLGAPMDAARLALEHGVGYIEGGPDDPNKPEPEPEPEAEPQTVTPADVGPVPPAPPSTEA